MLEKDINKIDTSSEPFASKSSSGNIDDDIEQDKVEVLLRDFKAHSTILSSSNVTLNEKDPEVLINIIVVANLLKVFVIKKLIRNA